MSQDRAQDVKNFKAGAGQTVPAEPRMPSAKDLDLCLNMLGAEFTELIFALTGQDVETSPRISHAKEAVKKLIFAMADPEAATSGTDGVDVTAVARQCADLEYVTIGTALTFGIPDQHVWDVVHKANMAKLGGPKRGDGKQLPPQGWEPPNIASLFDDLFGNPLIPRDYKTER